MLQMAAVVEGDHHGWTLSIHGCLRQQQREAHGVEGGGAWIPEAGRVKGRITWRGADAVGIDGVGRCAGGSKNKNNLPRRPLPAQDNKPLAYDGDKSGEGAGRRQGAAGSGGGR